MVKSVKYVLYEFILLIFNCKLNAVLILKMLTDNQNKILKRRLEVKFEAFECYKKKGRVIKVILKWSK